jgi:pyridoxamine 5'-phosphate oxidase
VADIVTTTANSGSATADFTAATEPFALFESWFAEASASELNDPNAMSVASVDADGLPNVRTILLKGLDPASESARGFVFYTNTLSAKGREFEAAPKAALLFHWKSLRRQVRIRGRLERVPDAEADAYYVSRPRESRIGAWASEQSAPLASRRALEDRVAALQAKFEGLDIPRPPHWSGYRLTPTEIEFWADRPHRLHDRIVFRRAGPGAAWTITRLFP